MDVNETAGYSLVYEGKKYFFCSQGCRAEFKRRPQEYLKSAEFSCGKSESKGEKRDV
jgi:Cu+-exporting ATPase